MDPKKEEPKKKELDRATLLAELQNSIALLDGENTAFLANVIPLIKKIFGKVFILEHHFTFEELQKRVTNFDSVCTHIFHDLEQIKEEKKACAEESRKNKRDKQARERTLAADQRLATEQIRYDRCTRVAQHLQQEEIKQKLFDFCGRITEYQFLKQKCTNKQATQIVFDFLWIVNKTYPLLYERLDGALVRSLKQRLHLKHPPPPIKEDIPTLLHKIQNDLELHNRARAEENYQKLSQLYQYTPYQDKKKFYDSMFSLWFRLKFQQ